MNIQNMYEKLSEYNQAYVGFLLYNFMTYVNRRPELVIQAMQKISEIFYEKFSAKLVVTPDELNQLVDYLYTRKSFADETYRNLYLDRLISLKP